MSDEVEKRVVAVLDRPYHSPFGNPIPALDKLGIEGVPEAEWGVRCSDLDASSPVGATVVQAGELLQMDAAAFRDLAAAGVRIGGHVTVSRNGDGSILLTTDTGGEATLPPEMSHALRVVLDDGEAVR